MNRRPSLPCLSFSRKLRTAAPELNADGTFVLEGLPDQRRNGLGKSGGSLDAGEGLWLIRQYSDGEWGLRLSNLKEMPRSRDV